MTQSILTLTLSIYDSLVALVFTIVCFVCIENCFALLLAPWSSCVTIRPSQQTLGKT